MLDLQKYLICEHKLASKSKARKNICSVCDNISQKIKDKIL